MGLKENVIKTTTFSLMDSVSNRIFSVIAFIIIANLLSRTDIGIIGIVAGIVSFLTFLAVAPETIFLRDFQKIKDKKLTNNYISAFMYFWGLRSAILTVISILLSVFVLVYYNSFASSVYLFGAVIVLNLGLLSSLIKETFFVAFRQPLVTKFNVILNFAFIGLVSLVFFYPNLIFYTLVLVTFNIFNAFVWFIILKKYLNFRFALKDKGEIISKSLTSFSIWNHLMASSINVLYKADTLILALFAPLVVIGNYTIALNIANIFFTIPMILQKSVTVGISNLKNWENIGELMGIFVKYFFLLSVTQLIFFYAFGLWIVQLFTPTYVSEIFLYSIIILFGVTLVNIVRPLITLSIIKTDPKKVFLYVFFPSLISGVASYVILGYLYGVMGVVVGNIVSYAILVATLLIYLKKEFPIRLKFRIMTPTEKHIVKEAMSSIKRKNI